MQVAILGTGLMGLPMARRLCADGHQVRVWNRTAAKAVTLTRDGAEVAATPAQAVTGAAMVITMLADGPVVEDVLFGQGTASALAAGTLHVDMSSIPPVTARHIAERLAAQNVAALDAPVSGGVPAAEAGDLAIMAGGPADAFSRALPVLKSLGRAIHVGPTGTGQVAKLCNQVIVAGAIQAVAEALLLAAGAGADPDWVRLALVGGFADSKVLQNHGQRMAMRDFRPGGKVRSHLKDLESALDLARQVGLTLPLVDLCRDGYHRLTETGLGDSDHNALLLDLEQANPGHRLGTETDRLS